MLIKNLLIEEGEQDNLNSKKQDLLSSLATWWKSGLEATEDQRHL